MAQLSGLTTLGVDINPPHMGEWPWKIGQYILNFGAIEFLSYQYFNSLEATRADFDKNLNRLLGARIARIIQLIQACGSIPSADKVKIQMLWIEAKELSHWRNRIAHNPVLPTWKPGSDSDRDPPDFIGIPDVKQLKLTDEIDSTSLSGMDKLIDATFDLATRIHAAFAKLREA